MSESTTAGGHGDEFDFTSPSDGEKFVRTLRDHRGFCYWCLSPLEVNPTVRFPDEPEGWPLETAATFDEYSHPEEDVPPDRTNVYGQVVEHSRSEQTICGSCGVIDPAPEDSRGRETTLHALRHLCSVLEENGVEVNLFAVLNTVDEWYADGRTGQSIELAGAAIYRPTSRFVTIDHWII